MTKPLIVESILSQYTDLRENYEFHHKYDIAGKFFVNESEMDRKYTTIQKNKDDTLQDKDIISEYIKKKSKISSIINYIYYKIADYGESYAKPLVIVGGITFGTWILFAIQTCWNGELNMLYATERTIASVVPYISNHPDSNVWDYIIKATALPFVGISFIGLKRRFERKYRH